MSSDSYEQGTTRLLAAVAVRAGIADHEPTPVYRSGAPVADRPAFCGPDPTSPDRAKHTRRTSTAGSASPTPSPTCAGSTPTTAATPWSGPARTTSPSWPPFSANPRSRSSPCSPPTTNGPTPMRDAFLIFLLVLALVFIGAAIWMLRMLFTYQAADEDEAEGAAWILIVGAVAFMLMALSAVTTVGHAVGVPMPYTFTGEHHHG